MRRVLLTGALVLSLLPGLDFSRGRVSAQERTLCEDGAGPTCTDDRIEVVFPVLGVIKNSEYRYEDFVAGTAIQTEVLLDAASADISAWSYGVRHDPAILELDMDSVGVTGTLLDATSPAALIAESGFVRFTIGETGYTQAVALSTADPLVLPVGRYVVASATYNLLADAGTEGTRIEVASFDPSGGEATPIEVTVGAGAGQPRAVADGVVRRVEIGVEICDNGVDDDEDRLVDAEDPDCQDCVCPNGDCLANGLYFGSEPVEGRVELDDSETTFVISSRNDRPLSGFEFGVRMTAEGGLTIYEFAGDLASEPGRPLSEIIFTDLLVNIITPETPNTLASSMASVIGIERGSALAGFAGDDFLVFDLMPQVGGPGFFVGYIAEPGDGDNQIPATPVADDCPLNELLVIRLDRDGGGGCDLPENGLFFGPIATTMLHDARNTNSLVISSRNVQPLTGFQFGVRTIEGPAGTALEFAGDLASLPGRPVSEIIFTDLLVNIIEPATLNTAMADEIRVANVRRGSALEAFAGGDFLVFDLEPEVGGPGFTVGYIADSGDNGNVIAATGNEDTCPTNELLIIDFEPVGTGGGDCEDYALYFGPEAVTGEVDNGDERRFVISTRNAEPLTAFQFGVAIRPSGDDFTYTFTSDIASEPGRPLSEIIFTDLMVNIIEPRTPNTLLASFDNIDGIDRGSAVSAFGGNDFLVFELEPEVGGPGFFVGYAADSGDNDQAIPATPPGTAGGAGGADECPLNEVLVIRIGDGGGPGNPDCYDDALYFGEVATSEQVDARGGASYVISSRNQSALTGFQFGVRTIEADGAIRHEFAADLASEPGRPLSEIIFTDELVNIIMPRTPNTLLADSDAILAIERGSAIAAFSNDDFLVFDLMPEVGGPGFTVGYVAQSGDLSQVIPATPPETEDSCPLNELLVIRFDDGVGRCPDFGLYFGLEVSTGLVDAGDADEFHISSRNESTLTAFQFGVTITTDGDLSTFEFSDNLASEPGRPLSEIIFTDELVNIIVPQTPNRMISPFNTVEGIDRGADLLPFAGDDFLVFDLMPEVGGPGFTVGYISEMADGNRFIPATPRGDGVDCPVNDLLVLRLSDGTGIDREFNRADTDGNGRYNVNDAVEILLVLFDGKAPRFDCPDAFDADDNGVLAMQDAIVVIDRLFRRGPQIPAPTLDCGLDPTTDDDLHCPESNCF